jgi:hypothetical protein
LFVPSKKRDDFKIIWNASDIFEIQQKSSLVKLNDNLLYPNEIEDLIDYIHINYI